MPKNVTIVGGGPSGIVSALLLSEHHNVTLIESTNRLGGC